jgi:uncharacterized protein (DUF427 family)
MTEKKEKPVKWQPSERWVRVKLGEEFVADSIRPYIVWDKSHIPQYFFPREDVQMERLVATGRSRGERTLYHIHSDGQVIENAAWSYTSPLPEHEPLRDTIVFRWEKMDAWFEEDEQIFVHPRDPYTRVDTIPSSRHVRVEIDGVTVADTIRPYLLFETWSPTRYYIHPDDVNMSLLTATDTHTQCPYKGTASYWSVTISDKIYKDIVWSYSDPIPEIPKIKGLLCFFNERVDLYVDGVLQERPLTSWS